MHLFVNIKPFNKSIYIEFPSVVTGNQLIDYEKDKETGELTFWLGRLHGVISPGYG